MMKPTMKLLAAVVLCVAAWSAFAAPAHARVKVVATLSEYGWLAREIGGEHVDVFVICPEGQDPHFLAPRPSYAVELASADLLISTGLDLELWLGALLDKAANARVAPGQPGYVSAAEGVPLLDVPTSADRSQGDVHIYGNPHLHTSPMNVRLMARQVAQGLTRVDPARAAEYAAGAERLVAALDERAFGRELVAVLGGETLAKLVLKGKLWSFLGERDYQGKKLIERLGGWYGRLRPLVGQAVVSYHRNWSYLARDLGLTIPTTIELKPGVAPTAGHVAAVLETIRARDVRVLLATSYDNDEQVRSVARRAGVRVAAVPLHAGPRGYFALMDTWADALLGPGAGAR